MKAVTKSEKGYERLWPVVSLIPVAIFQIVVFFSDPGHFFQGDTVYWLYYRHLSWNSFFRAFVSLDGSGWYRPLSNRILESIFYPFYGLNPIPYHLALFPLLMLNALAVYEFAWMVTRRRLAAFIAVFFFSTHFVNTYVTYDVSFTPELLYSLFYLTSVITYLRYLRTRKTGALAASLLCCLAAFCSKESAITLPVMLVVIHVFETGSSFTLRSIGTLKWHFGTFLAYAAFVVGYLKVAGIGTKPLFSRLQDPALAGYQVVFDRGILLNASRALSEVLMLTHWSNAQNWFTPYLKVIQFGSLALLLLTLLSRERKIVLLGLIWLFVALAPVLTLANHFMSYYTFLPIAGLALAVGIAFDFGFERLAGVSRSAALVVVGIVFGAVAVVSAVSSTRERIAVGLLGGSSRAALTAIETVRAIRPHLAPDTTLFFLNRGAPQLSWYDGQGGLFRMAFNQEKIAVLHAGDGELLDLDQVEDNNLIVLRYADGVFQKLSPSESVNEVLSPEDKSGHELSITPDRVTAGKGSYTLRIEGLHRVEVHIYYRLNGGPKQSFWANLKDDGDVTFEVGPGTPKGTYQFVAIVLRGGSKWFRADKTVVID